MFVTSNNLKQIQNMEVFGRHIFVHNLIAVKVYLNNFGILIGNSAIKFLLPLFFLTGNNNSFLLFGTGISFASGHIKGIDLANNSDKNVSFVG